MTIALLYAFDQEVKPLLKTRPADTLFCRTGMGVANAHEAAEKLLERSDPDLLISVGYAGATAPQLKTGDLVITTEVRSEAGDVMKPDATARRRLIDAVGVKNAAAGAVAKDSSDGATAKNRGDRVPWHEGPLLTVWNPLKTPAEKGLAGSQGVIACDMETAAIAAVAIKHSIPWLSVRVIFDPMNEELNPRSLWKLPQMIRWHLRCRWVLSQILNRFLTEIAIEKK